MNIPGNLLYSKEHEWVRFEGNKAYIGITDYAQASLGDIVFVELPEMDAEVEAMGEAGLVESVKAVSPVFSPLSGRIVEINDKLEQSPELLNSEPYEQFIFAIEIKDISEKEELLDAENYQKNCCN